MNSSQDSARYTLAALRAAVQQQSLAPPVLASLQYDPRAGARALFAQAKRQITAVQDEAARIEQLLVHERALWAAGHLHVCGVDEVGVGPLLGPVVAAAVVLPAHESILHVNDSKKLSPAKRAQLAAEIHRRASAIGIGQCSALEIDAMNIHRATREAMRRAVMALGGPASHLLVDAHRVPGIKVPQTAIIGGDRVSHAIAAASIVAKVFRDRLMADVHAAHPQYGVATHKGYGTARHLEVLRRLGPTPEHRRSFAPVRDAARLHGCT